MKKNIVTTVIVAGVLFGFSQIGMPCYADSMPYEPIFEAAQISESITSTSTVEPVRPASNVAQATNSSEEKAPLVPPVENENLQSALMQLDGAQVEIRNQLLQYKSEYTDIDNQYKLIKEQRKLKAKQVRITERKIRNLDATKEKIRKNMN